METLKLNEPGGEMGAHATQTEAIQTQKKMVKSKRKKDCGLNWSIITTLSSQRKQIGKAVK